VKTGYGIEDFRFSGSYVSRYHHCSGSAVLDEAIPGFKPVGGERAASSLGTRLHKVVQRILTQCEDWEAAAELLDQLAAVRNVKDERVILLKSEAQYYRWWILDRGNTSAPPVPFEIIELLHEVQPERVEEGEDGVEEIMIPAKDIMTSPLLIRFLAQAVRYIYSLLDEVEGAEVWCEQSRTAEWTQTKPQTSADIVLTNGVKIIVVDLKTGTIPVEAAHNEQGLYYVETYRTKEVEAEFHIIQPGNISAWEVPLDYLAEWQASVLRAEQRILDGDRTLVPGKHCQFCPANPYTKGERGAPSCPAQVEVLFGTDDLAIILED